MFSSDGLNYYGHRSSAVANCVLQRIPAVSVLVGRGRRRPFEVLAIIGSASEDLAVVVALSQPLHEEPLLFSACEGSSNRTKGRRFRQLASVTSCNFHCSSNLAGGLIVEKTDPPSPGDRRSLFLRYVDFSKPDGPRWPVCIRHRASGDGHGRVGFKSGERFCSSIACRKPTPSTDSKFGQARQGEGGSR